MITKIFQSLVLFPSITYTKTLSSGFLLLDIFEIRLGIIKCIFKNGNLKEEIYFIHKKFNEKEEGFKLKNWYVLGDNTILVNEIGKIIEPQEKEDFNFYNDKIYNRSIAFGVVLTITSKCNIFCYYCFNDIDYDLKERNTRKNKDLKYWTDIVDGLYNQGTRVVILTGGEPMVAPFIWDLLDYLKEKGIFVHINTNGTLLQDKILEKFNNNYSLNLMISMHEFNDKDYYAINKKGLEMTFGTSNVPIRFKTMFTDKVKQLRKINDYRNISVEFLTILVWKNILNLEKIYQFGRNCGVHFTSWQFFRLYGTKNNTGATKSMMDLAVNKMYILNKKYGFDNKIVDPVPFCVTKNIDRAAEVIDGVLSDTHDVKTIITTEGYVQMMSAYDNNYWNIADTDMKTIFQSDFVKKQLNNGFLPEDCKDCSYKETCRGGSRMDANIRYGSYGKFDPIGDIKNKIT